MPRKRSASPARAAPAPFAYEGLDRVLHERARLSILTSLATSTEGRVFPELKELCGLTDGNLNRHLEVLREADLVAIWKAAGAARPQTLVSLTKSGRARFLAYLEALEQVVRDARAGDEPAALRSGRRPLRPAPGSA